MHARSNEDVANTVTSGVGFVFAIAALAMLIRVATHYGTVWHVVSGSVYGASLVFLNTASMIYHSQYFPTAKTTLRALDHSAIFLLIAGTYTPFTLVNLHGPWGWSLLGGIWTLALIGIACQRQLRQWRFAEIGLYLGMGWAVVIATKPLMAAVAPGGLLLLLTGGLAYTLGIAFYAWHRLPYHHAIWHLFVLAGTMAHFCAILLYVMPRRR